MSMRNGFATPSFCYRLGVRMSKLVLKEIRLNIRTLEQDLAAFEDIKNLKRWLKRIQVIPAASPFDAMPF